MTDQLDLDGLEGLARAATPGERFWSMDTRDQATNLQTSGAGDYVLSAQADVSNYGLSVDAYIDANDADLDFIRAANPATVLSLITRLRASEAATAAAVEALRIADEALRSYACCGLGNECVRTPDQCRAECGQPAGLALDVIAALPTPSSGGE